MKLRHPWLIRTAAWAGAVLVRGWVGSLRYRYTSLGPPLDPHQLPRDSRYIYAFWHEYLLMPTYFYSGIDCAVLIGRHADGDLIAGVARRFGFRTVRGSTTRGGVEAVRKILHGETHGHLALTPDGPVGPRRLVQPGLPYLASRLGLPVVPAGFGCDRPWRGASWDRFAVPRPFSTACCVTADPIDVPPTADRDALEEYRRRIETALHQVTVQAEHWAESGVAPERVGAPHRDFASRRLAA